MHRSCRASRAHGDGRRATRRRPRSTRSAADVDLRRCRRRTTVVPSWSWPRPSRRIPVAARQSTSRLDRTRLVDLVVVAVTLTIGFAFLAVVVAETDPPPDEVVVQAVVGVVATLLLWWRRRWPLAVALLMVPLSFLSSMVQIAGLVAVFTVAVCRRAGGGRRGSGGVLAPDACPARAGVRLRSRRTSRRCCSRPRWRPRRWVGACSCEHAASCWRRCASGRSGPRPSNTSA